MTSTRCRPQTQLISGMQCLMPTSCYVSTYSTVKIDLMMHCDAVALRNDSASGLLLLPGMCCPLRIPNGDQMPGEGHVQNSCLLPSQIHHDFTTIFVKSELVSKIALLERGCIPPLRLWKRTSLSSRLLRACVYIPTTMFITDSLPVTMV